VTESRPAEPGPPPTPPRPVEPPEPEPTAPPEAPGFPPGEPPAPRPGDPVPLGQGPPAPAAAGAPGDARVVKRVGRFSLVEAGDGFVWTFADRAGGRWYWHPDERRWTGSPQTKLTAEEATAGLDPDAPQAEAQFRHHEARPAAPEGGAGGDL
jgi:hypothetical protein